MHLIDPYRFVVPLPMQSFVAPVGFNPDTQELNIAKSYFAYSDVNKKYVFSISSGYPTTVLPAVSGRSYAYSENGSTLYTAIGSGTVTWTIGSDRRVIIVIDSSATIQASLPMGVIWAYLGNKVTSVIGNGTTVKYIHCESLNSITSIPPSSFYYAQSLTGVLTIPPTMTVIGYQSFYNAWYMTKIIIPSTIISMGNDCFSQLPVLSEVDCYAINPPSFTWNPDFVGSHPTGQTLHVPVGRLAAYRAANIWKDFINIIEDL